MATDTGIGGPTIINLGNRNSDRSSGTSRGRNGGDRLAGGLFSTAVQDELSTDSNGRVPQAGGGGPTGQDGSPLATGRDGAPAHGRGRPDGAAQVLWALQQQLGAGEPVAMSDIRDAIIQLGTTLAPGRDPASNAIWNDPRTTSIVNHYADWVAQHIGNILNDRGVPAAVAELNAWAIGRPDAHSRMPPEISALIISALKPPVFQDFVRGGIDSRADHPRQPDILLPLIRHMDSARPELDSITKPNHRPTDAPPPTAAPRPATDTPAPAVVLTTSNTPVSQASIDPLPLSGVTVSDVRPTTGGAYGLSHDSIVPWQSTPVSLPADPPVTSTPAPPVGDAPRAPDNAGVLAILQMWHAAQSQGMSPEQFIDRLMGMDVGQLSHTVHSSGGDSAIVGDLLSGLSPSAVSEAVHRTLAEVGPPAAVIVWLTGTDPQMVVTPTAMAAGLSGVGENRALPALPGDMAAPASLIINPTEVPLGPRGIQLISAVEAVAAVGEKELPVTRDPYVWPFSKDSIWNMPIGDGARYSQAPVPSHAVTPTQGYGIDPQVIIIAHASPPAPVYSRDAADVSSTASLGRDTGLRWPIPKDFGIETINGNGHGPATGYSGAVLLADGKTAQEFSALWKAPGEPATVHGEGYNRAQFDVYGDGLTGEAGTNIGGHDGSGLSSIGGTLRIGELTGSDPIRHATKLSVDLTRWGAAMNGENLHVWPASTAGAPTTDGAERAVFGSQADGYSPFLKMGSLLAIPKSADIGSLGLETAPAMKLAKAWQDYGVYIADDSGSDQTRLAVECGVDEEMEAAGIRMTSHAPAGYESTAWHRDMNRMMGALREVVNNGPDSIGGGGAPMAPLAPDFREPVPA